MKKGLLLAGAALIAASSFQANADLNPQYFKLYTPAEANVFKNTCFQHNGNPRGMGFIQWEMNGDIALLNDSETLKTISLYYGDKLMAVVDCSDQKGAHGGLTISSVMGAAGEDDLIEFNSPKIVSMYFDMSGVETGGDDTSGDVGSSDVDADKLFLQDGKWTVSVEEGVFGHAISQNEDGTSNYSPIPAFTVEYNYTNENEKLEANYIFTPAENSVVEDLQTITLQFPNAKQVYDQEDAKLYNPSGVAVRGKDKYSHPEYNGEAIIKWYFQNSPATAKTQYIIDWVPGTWTFEIPANALIVDNQPYPDKITALWTIKGTETDVTIIEGDFDRADYYTVYNLEGQKVAEGDSNVIVTLAKGLYIINGKKVLVK